jgi:hypothetical protein
MACWAAPRLIENLPQFPVRTTGEEQVVALERYFKLPPQPVVVVGSSLAYHLKDWFFVDGDVRNMAIPGDSPLTGLASHHRGRADRKASCHRGRDQYPGSPAEPATSGYVWHRAAGSATAAAPSHARRLL